MEARLEKAFAEAVKKHIGIRKQIERKVRQIMEHPVKEIYAGFTLARSRAISSSYTCIVPCAEKKETLNLLPAQIVPHPLTKPLSSCSWDPITKLTGLSNTIRLNPSFYTKKCRFKEHIKPDFPIISNHINHLAWPDPILPKSR